MCVSYMSFDSSACVDGIPASSPCTLIYNTVNLEQANILVQILFNNKRSCRKIIFHNKTFYNLYDL